MVVDEHGPLAGTIGGGRAEASLVDEVCAALRAGALAAGWRRQQHRLRAEEPSGLICGGEQCVVWVPLSGADLDAVSALVKRLVAGERSGWRVSPAGWQFCDVPLPEASWRAGDDWSYTHAAGVTHRAWLIGGGHVSRALTPLLVDLDFHVTVIEQRNGIGSFLRNDAAHVRLQHDYAALRTLIPSGERNFVGIMTHDCGADLLALDALDGVLLGYLGLLGSRAKIRRLVDGRVLPPFFHAPMGLPINSQTPAEIAVSIAAEWVRVRAAQR